LRSEQSCSLVRHKNFRSLRRHAKNYCNS
jgi:hypothetical protein